MPPPLDALVLQLEADRISLRLVQKLLASERHARVLEVASTLHSMPALNGALKLANHHRCGLLLLSERLDGRLMAAEAELWLLQADAMQPHQPAHAGSSFFLPASAFRAPCHLQLQHACLAGMVGRQGELASAPPGHVASSAAGPAGCTVPPAQLNCVVAMRAAHRATALAERIAAFIEQRQEMERAAAEAAEPEDDYGEDMLHGQRQVGVWFHAGGSWLGDSCFVAVVRTPLAFSNMRSCVCPAGQPTACLLPPPLW